MTPSAPATSVSGFAVRTPAEKLSAALEQVGWVNVLPTVSPAALASLKFSEVLPPELAVATISERVADREGAPWQPSPAFSGQAGREMSGARIPPRCRLTHRSEMGA